MSLSSRFRILYVSHESRVTAVTTNAGGRRLLELGLMARLERAGGSAEITRVVVPGTPSGNEVADAFAVAAAVSEQVGEALAGERDVIVLSGSCHMALGAVAGLPNGERGVVWLDAHGDFNTPETTGSGLLDGMTLAAITGRCWKTLAGTVGGFSPVPEEQVVMAGVRDLDPAEEDLLEASTVTRLSTADARIDGDDALRALGERAGSVYVHVDLDVLDPTVGPANAFATPGGFSVEDLCGFLARARRLCPTRVLGLASYDPATDPEAAVGRAAVEAAGAWAEGVSGETVE